MTEKEEKNWFGKDCDESIKIGEYEKEQSPQKKILNKMDALRMQMKGEPDIPVGIKEKAKSLLPDLKKIQEDASKQGVPEQPQLPDLKKHSEIYDTPLINKPLSFFNNKNRESYQKLMEFDTTNLNHLFGYYAYRAIQSFINETLSDKSGYPQSDKTYAVYPHFLKEMKRFAETDFNDLERKEQETFLKIGERGMASFMTHLLEK